MDLNDLNLSSIHVSDDDTQDGDLDCYNYNDIENQSDTEDSILNDSGLRIIDLEEENPNKRRRVNTTKKQTTITATGIGRNLVDHEAITFRRLSSNKSNKIIQIVKDANITLQAQILRNNYIITLLQGGEETANMVKAISPPWLKILDSGNMFCNTCAKYYHLHKNDGTCNVRKSGFISENGVKPSKIATERQRQLVRHAKTYLHIACTEDAQQSMKNALQNAALGQKQTEIKVMSTLLRNMMHVVLNDRSYLSYEDHCMILYLNNVPVGNLKHGRHFIKYCVDEFLYKHVALQRVQAFFKADDECTLTPPLIGISSDKVSLRSLQWAIYCLRAVYNGTIINFANIALLKGNWAGPDGGGVPNLSSF
jgi:hypothetical protein